MKYKRGRSAAWEHGTKLVDEESVRVKCNYCQKIVPTITRLRDHLARVGKEVTACPSVPDSVRLKFLKFCQKDPYPRVVKPDKNQNIGEGSNAGGQSSHEHRYAQTEDAAGGTLSIVDLDPEERTDIAVPIKALRDGSSAGGESNHEQTNRYAQTEKGIDDRTLICAVATAEKAKSDEVLIKEAKTAQKRLRWIEKKYKECRENVQAEFEQFRNIQEMNDYWLKEKVQEVEMKEQELRSLKVALEAKEKKLESFRTALVAKERELAAKDEEMERLRREAVAAQAEWYMEGRDEIITKAKKVGFNHKLLLPDPTE